MKVKTIELILFVLVWTFGGVLLAKGADITRTMFGVFWGLTLLVKVVKVYCAGDAKYKLHDDKVQKH